MNDNSNSGYISPSLARYIITDKHAHNTLENGDVVVMVETPFPHLQNLLLRERDMTLHYLQDGSSQYVHVRKI